MHIIVSLLHLDPRGKEVCYSSTSFSGQKLDQQACVIGAVDRNSRNIPSTPIIYMYTYPCNINQTDQSAVCLHPGSPFQALISRHYQCLKQAWNRVEIPLCMRYLINIHICNFPSVQWNWNVWEHDSITGITGWQTLDLVTGLFGYFLHKSKEEISLFKEYENDSIFIYDL